MSCGVSTSNSEQLWRKSCIVWLMECHSDVYNQQYSSLQRRQLLKKPPTIQHTTIIRSFHPQQTLLTTPLLQRLFTTPQISRTLPPQYQTTLPNLISTATILPSTEFSHKITPSTIFNRSSTCSVWQGFSSNVSKLQQDVMDSKQQLSSRRGSIDRSILKQIESGADVLWRLLARIFWCSRRVQVGRLASRLRLPISDDGQLLMVVQSSWHSLQSLLLRLSSIYWLV